MKHIFLSACALFVFALQTYAQTAGAIWIGSRSVNPKSEAAAILSGWESIYQAYNSGDSEKGFAFYTEDAAEITPDGRITFGKSALREGWNAFMKMLDEKPQFNYENPQVRMLSNDVALLIWDSESKLKMGGQDIGGKTKGMAVLHKINKEWKVEFDVITPVMPMPGSGN